MLGDQVVAWAQRKFGTDFDRSESIRDLQERLSKLGHRLFADGVVGPSTLEALRAQQELEDNQPKEDVLSGSGSFEVNGGETAPSSSSAAAEFDESEDEEGLESETIDPPSNQKEPEAQTDTEGLTAQPVALSDSALESVSDDRLGFAPYVRAVARFLLAV